MLEALFLGAYTNRVRNVVYYPANLNIYVLQTIFYNCTVLVLTREVVLRSPISSISRFLLTFFHIA